jgi:hypothetical protein
LRLNIEDPWAIATGPSVARRRDSRPFRAGAREADDRVGEITEEVTMHAEVGDELVVDSMHMGEEPRKGEILAVRVEEGREHYVVRWDDTGHETLFFPGPTSHALPVGKSR